MENQAILRRLQDKQPNYNVNKWEEEEMERKRILSNICEYDYILEHPGSNLNAAVSQSNYNSGPPDFIVRMCVCVTQCRLRRRRVQ